MKNGILDARLACNHLVVGQSRIKCFQDASRFPKEPQHGSRKQPKGIDDSSADSDITEDQFDDHRQSDNQKTGERQSDLQSQCKIFSSFSEFLSSELHARDSDIANFMFSLENQQPGETVRK